MRGYWPLLAVGGAALLLLGFRLTGLLPVPWWLVVAPVWSTLGLAFIAAAVSSPWKE